MDFKRIALLSGAALIALALWLAWFCQPERQVRRHTAVLLKAVERRNWEKLKNLIGDGYADRWQQDKPFLAEVLPQVFGQFLFLNIEHDTTGAEVAGGVGRTVTRVKMSGSGGPGAQYVIEKVNNLSEPFTFHWSQRSGWPWDWELTRVDHPSLDPGGMPRL
jgi:hypothetical protein